MTQNEWTSDDKSCERGAVAARHQPDGNGGSIPARSLLFAWGHEDEGKAFIRKHHYSGKPPATFEFVGSLHLPNGLLGMPGTMVAACFLGFPASRWTEQVIELSRLARSANRVPLTMLISLCVSRIKRQGFDLLISYADKAEGHHGGVYQAACWKYAGSRERQITGCIINGELVHGRVCNHRYGTRSAEKLRALLNIDVQPHYDEGKHLYWKALGPTGIAKAERLGLKSLPYPKAEDVA